MRTLQAWAYLLGQSGLLWLPILIATGVAAGLAWSFARRGPTGPAPRPPTSGAAG